MSQLEAATTLSATLRVFSSGYGPIRQRSAEAFVIDWHNPGFRCAPPWPRFRNHFAVNPTDFLGILSWPLPACGKNVRIVAAESESIR
jgi:hypothetical protein